MLALNNNAICVPGCVFFFIIIKPDLIRDFVVVNTELFKKNIKILTKMSHCIKNTTYCDA